MSHSYLDGIRIRALAGVMDPDEEATLRDIFRWYAKEFNTQLHDVEGLPLEFVLLHWFECQYQELGAEEQLELARELLETPDQKKARLEAEAKDEEEFLEKARQMNEKRTKKTPARAAFEKQLARALQKENANSETPPPQDEVVIKYVPTGDLDAELEKHNGPLPGSNRKRK